MRVLLDECVPRPLKRDLPEHSVNTVTEMGWHGVENGELLRRMREAGFEAFVTVDQSLAFQQNLRGGGIRVVILVARTNKIQDLQPLVPHLRETLMRIQPGEMIRVRAEGEISR
jgi:hypothetical protein